MGRSILIVDDHAAFRRAALRLLESMGFTVVGEAADGAAAMTAVAELHPEIVLLDVHLPDRDGFEVAQSLAAEAPNTLVILTSSRDASDYAARLPGAAILGFIGKSDLSEATVAQLVGAA